MNKQLVLTLPELFAMACSGPAIEISRNGVVPLTHLRTQLELWVARYEAQ